MCDARRGDRRRSGAATGSSPTSCTQVATPNDARGEQDRPRPAAERSPSTSRSRRRGAGRVRRLRPAVGPHRRRASTRSSSELEARLPEGPHYYPDGVVTDQPETFLAAELLREKLLRDRPRRAAALDHGHRRGDRARRRRGARPRRTNRTRATECSGIRAWILVERESQKGIVIGQGRRGPEGGGHRARATSSRRCSAPACTSRPGCGSTATGSAAPMPSTGSGIEFTKPITSC